MTRIPILLVVVALSSLPSFGATKTWNGSVSGVWHTAANWTPVGLPANSDDLVFPSAGMNKATTNDFPLPALQVGSVTLSGSGYTLAGNGIFLVGPLTASYTIGTSSVSLPIEVSGSETFSVTSQLAFLTLSGDVQIDGGLGVSGAGSMTLSGIMSGPGGLTYAGGAATSSLTLSGANTYMGPTGVNSGTLVRARSSSSGRRSESRATSRSLPSRSNFRGRFRTRAVRTRSQEASPFLRPRRSRCRQVS